jgi:putative ABC transport system ATP-binding protein
LIINTTDLTRVYRLGASSIIAVNKVNLQIEEATFVAIAGPSGSGKTTLLNLMGLNDQPTSGKVFFKDKDTSLLTDRTRRKIRLQNIGFVFQTFNLLPTLTALENVELPMALTKVPRKTQRKKATELLEAVGLINRLQHRPKELSMGEMQRVAIARALANNPSLILADEPTGELDSETGTDIIKLLSDLCRKRKTTVIVATHDEKIVEVADVTYRIRDGSITR